MAVFSDCTLKSHLALTIMLRKTYFRERFQIWFCFEVPIFCPTVQSFKLNVNPKSKYEWQKEKQCTQTWKTIIFKYKVNFFTWDSIRLLWRCQNVELFKNDFRQNGRKKVLLSSMSWPGSMKTWKNYFYLEACEKKNIWNTDIYNIVCWQIWIWFKLWLDCFLSYKIDCFGSNY